MISRTSISSMMTTRARNNVAKVDLNQEISVTINERLRVTLQDLVDTIRGSDADDPIGSLFHLVKDAEQALEIVNVLEGPEESLDEDDIPEDDSPPECECCEGQGFGADADGAVACPQCAGTGVQPEGVRSIDDELGLDD